MKDIITHLIAFLVGSLTGVAGVYFGNKYTDRRREGQARKKEKEQFLRMHDQMPELIAEMKEDLSKPEHQFIRDFFLSRREFTVTPGSPCFFYYENDHENLQGKVHILENMGYVVDVTPGNAPKYRMTEEFVSLVLKEG